MSARVERHAAAGRGGARGWDNQLWRLGEGLAVRLPWATGFADTALLKEHTWVPVLAPRLPLAVPVPQRLGERSERFRRPWIVTTWAPGEPADRAPITCVAQASYALAGFLSALHRPAPTEVPADGKRGKPLAHSAEQFTELFGSALDRGLIPVPGAVRAIWEEAVAAPNWEGPPLWLHGDLHPANVLTDGGALRGVIDFGDLCTGDPAADLAAAWALLPEGGADLFRAAYRPALDAATRRRARGWAVMRALVGILVGEAGVHGRTGGKPNWGPPLRSRCGVWSPAGR